MSMNDIYGYEKKQWMTREKIEQLVSPDEGEAFIRHAQAKLHSLRSWPIGWNLLEKLIRIQAEMTREIVITYIEALETKKRGFDATEKGEV